MVCLGPGWGSPLRRPGLGAMSNIRKQVFVEKVLRKLFPNVPNGQEKKAPVILTSEKPHEKVTPKKAKSERIQPSTGSDTEIQSERRLYTVSLPPEGYIPCLPELNSCTESEKSSSDDDTEGPPLFSCLFSGETPPPLCLPSGRERDRHKETLKAPPTQAAGRPSRPDQYLHDQTKRKRTRKHKSKKNFKNHSNVHAEQSELEKQKSLLQEKLQPQHTDGTTISKNKKRKLKKKQQIKKKKAAGLLTKASGINFMYQPEESNSDQEDVRDTDGEDVKDTKEKDVKDTKEEDGGSANEKADAILNFLKSTQEIYVYDGVSKDSDSAAFMETTEELLKHLESHSMSPSDVFILDHMKTLLLLHDIERLKSALEMFPEHCMMPPDQARVISTFFNYWITHILPEKNSE